MLPIDFKGKDLGNDLLTGRDIKGSPSTARKCLLGYQALKRSHTEGSLMGSTSSNTFP